MSVGKLGWAESGVFQIDFTREGERTIICSVRDEVVTVCAWCDSKKELTKKLSERGVLVSHGICGFHSEQMRCAAKGQRGHGSMSQLRLDDKPAARNG